VTPPAPDGDATKPQPAATPDQSAAGGASAPPTPGRGADQPVPSPEVDADATRRLPSQTGETTIIPPVRPGETAMIPPVIGVPEDRGARWAARAGVPRPAADEEEEWVPTEEPGSPWWLPLVLGIGGLLLLALVGLGVYVAFHNRGNPAPVASASPSLSPSPTPSATPPQTPSATPSLSPSVATVTLPDLRNVAVADAQATLSQLGLNPQVTDQPNNTVPVGTVIAMDPAPGTAVALGSTVTLTVAVAPSPTPSPTPSVTVSPTPSSSGR
jgi:hypothetical protein